MSRYIDAEKLKTEIAVLKKGVVNKWKENPRSSIDDGFLTACSSFLEIVASLQQVQPEVDLEKEIEEYTNSCEGALEGQQGQVWEFDWEDITLVIDEAARHFYDLGLNARKV